MHKKTILLLITLSIISLLIGVSETNFHILVLSRIPRLFSIILVGIGLSISGLIMQQLSQNKFVSPTTAGTIDSAQLGILVSLILFSDSGFFQKMAFAFLFALVGSFLFILILKKLKFQNTVVIPLVGMMLGRIISSVSNFTAYRYDLVQNLSSWMQGDFSMIISGRYELLYISVPLVILAYFYAHKFTLVGMGEEFSASLGLNFKVVVNLGLVIVALISAAVVITVGRIPFLGLIIPNIVAIYQGDNLEKNLFPTAAFGIIFLLVSDILGRIIIYPYEIPIGLTVGVLGSFIFLWIIRRNS